MLGTAESNARVKGWKCELVKTCCIEKEFEAGTHFDIGWTRVG
jgi:hypothetical protein